MKSQMDGLFIALYLFNSVMTLLMEQVKKKMQAFELEAIKVFQAIK